jgi:hypothetical protein
VSMRLCQKCFHAYRLRRTNGTPRFHLITHTYNNGNELPRTRLQSARLATAAADGKKNPPHQSPRNIERPSKEPRYNSETNCNLARHSFCFAVYNLTGVLVVPVVVQQCIHTGSQTYSEMRQGVESRRLPETWHSLCICWIHKSFIRNGTLGPLFEWCKKMLLVARLKVRD